MLGLRCCARAFSSCGEQGLLFVAAGGFFIAEASLVVEHGLQQLWCLGFAVPPQWNLPRPGIEPVSLHWQVDSYPLHHQGSPVLSILYSWRCFLIRGQNDPWTLLLLMIIGFRVGHSVLWKELWGKWSPCSIDWNTCVLEGMKIFTLGTDYVT